MTHAQDCAIYDESELRACTCGTCDAALEKRIAELETLAARALKVIDAGMGSRQWEKIEDARAILREALNR